MVAAFALTHVFGKGGEKYSPDGTSGANAGILFLFVYGVSFAIIYSKRQVLVSLTLQRLSNHFSALNVSPTALEPRAWRTTLSSSMWR